MLKLFLPVLSAAEDPEARQAIPPSVQGLLGGRRDARVVGQAQVVVRPEVENLLAVPDADARPLRADDDALSFEQACRADLVKLAADLLLDAGKHLPDPS